MRSVLAMAAACVMVVSAVALATPPVDPNDGVLIAYQLTAQEVAQFSVEDGKPSTFWATWEGKNRDYIDMNTTNNVYTGDVFTGESDARITIKAAASAQGLYLYSIVQDNIWVDPNNDPKNDAVDIYIDAMSSEEIRNAPTGSFTMPVWAWAITKTTNQYQVWMGSSSQPKTMMRNFWDDLFQAWTFNPIELADQSLAIQAEPISIDETHKAQEWFIPWFKVGGINGITGELSGRRFGFTGGYNDQDVAATGAWKRLRWKQADAYSGPQTDVNAAGIANAALNSWGDIVMEDGMPAVSSSTTKRPMGMNHALKVNRNVRSEYYSLNGRKLNPVTLHGYSPAVTFRRTIDGSGVAQTMRSIVVK